MLRRVVVIDYGAGNVESVFNAISVVKVADQVLLSCNLEEIKAASHLILPGVGAFADCMLGLQKISGLVKEIKNQVLVEKKPFLGICVGMQILAEAGYENGRCQGLGLIGGEVRKIFAPHLKIPQMGWNELLIKTNNHFVLEGIKTGDHFYFANSYHFVCDEEKDILAQVEYNGKMSAIIAKNNIFATQFHPEKSGEKGLKLLRNFLNWRA